MFVLEEGCQSRLRKLLRSSSLAGCDEREDVLCGCREQYSLGLQRGRGEGTLEVFGVRGRETGVILLLPFTKT